MFKLNREFDQLWSKAVKANEKAGGHRFHRIFQQTKRFVTVGIYDSGTKQYALFDSVNFAGNYRYDKNIKPDEFIIMEKMVQKAS
jgi:hypothetical protein|tara:strand:- start:291 stop:545 length:255 start_codon:yes stop_codon:yes gene_type:complete